MRADRYYWVWLLLLCAYGFFHSAVYAISNPVFESPDEPGHLSYVNHYASGKGMPDQYESSEFEAEGHQNPLYYFTAGEIFRALGGPIAVSLPVSQVPAPSPLFNHRPNPFRSPRDDILFYGLRLCGCVLVGITVLQTGRAARIVLPIGHVWMVAPLFVAALPQFAFIGASISNDVLVASMGACVAYAASRCAIDPSSRKSWILLGVYLGLAFLAKKNGITLIPAALLFVGAVRMYSRKREKGFAGNVLLASAVALVLCLPVLIHNQLTYHELLGNQMEMDTMPNLVYPQALNSWHFKYIFPHVVPVSFVSQFGWMGVEIKPAYVWKMVWFLGLIASLGLVALFDRKRGAFALFCVTAFVSNVVGLLYYNLVYPQAQGRLLFPAMACLMLLCALGLFEISDRISFQYKTLAFLPLALWLFWFDLLCFYSNQNFYAWFGPKLGF